MRGSLGARARGIDRILASANDELVEGIFDVRRGIGLAPETGGVGVVLGEQRFRGALVVKHIVAEVWMKRLNPVAIAVAQHGLWNRTSPRPRVSEPQRWQQMKGCRFGSAVVD